MDRPAEGPDVRLSEVEIEAIAEAVARRLQGPPAVRLLDAAGLAAALGVERDWVYRNATRLRAIRLGGSNGRLRFDLALSLRALSDPEPPPRAPAPPRRHRQRSHRTSIGLELIDYES